MSKKFSHWWRAYDECVDDPKLQRLSDESFRFWFNLCCVCSAFGGNLPSISDLAFKMRMQERKAVRLLGELRAANLIDEDDQGIRPHNWHVRQYKSDTDRTAAERQRRYRNGHRYVTDGPNNQRQRQSTEKKEAKKEPSQGEQTISMALGSTPIGNGRVH